MEPLVIIPARGGSKGVPGKNIKLLNGKPLIQYTIEAALEVTNKENIVVSTDSLEIKSVVEDLGISVPSLRPLELASDTAGSYDVLRYELGRLENEGKTFKYLIFLQPTSPFRTGRHIMEALNLFNNSLDMVVSVKETKANPYFVLREEDEEGYLRPSKTFTADRRQDVPIVYELNGAIYIINTISLKQMRIPEFSKVKKYLMDERASHDIDTIMDWWMAEYLISQ